MGSWFSNISIRKRDGLDIETVKKAVCGAMEGLHYLPADSEEEADEVCAILSLEGSRWFTVYSEILGFEQPEDFSRMGLPMSKVLNTDVLGISCFDSDYIFLNLLNAAEKVDAWVGVGMAAVADITRRTNLPKWKDKVSDHEAFKKAVKTKYVFAEEVLGEVAPWLGLPMEQSRGELEFLDEFDPEGTAQYLYFKYEQGGKTEPSTGLPVLGLGTISGQPCFPERPHAVHVVNKGGEGKGLSVHITGPFVEKDELKVSEIYLLQNIGSGVCPEPIPAEKTRLSNGEWAYTFRAPDFVIPAGKNGEFAVNFTPQGDRRKSLDVTVLIVPDENPAGGIGWNVWMLYGSKEEFFRQQKEIIGKLKVPPHILKEFVLDPADFD